MATSPDPSAKAIVAFYVSLGFTQQCQRLWRVDVGTVGDLAVDQSVQQKRLIGLMSNRSGQFTECGQLGPRGVGLGNPNLPCDRYFRAPCWASPMAPSIPGHCERDKDSKQILFPLRAHGHRIQFIQHAQIMPNLFRNLDNFSAGNRESDMRRDWSERPDSVW